MFMKTCNVCGETKPLDAFSVLEKGALGRHPACKECRNLQAKNYYAAKHDEILESNVSGESVLVPTVDTRMDLVPNNTRPWWRHKAAGVPYATILLRMGCCMSTTVILLVKSGVFCVDTVILLWVI